MRKRPVDWRATLPVAALWGGLAGCNTPERVYPPGPRLTVGPSVAVRNDQALVLWSREESFTSNVYATSFNGGDSTWSTPVLVHAGIGPEVALSSSGRALALFAIPQAGRSITAVAMRVGGVWGDTLELGSSSIHRAVAADAAGNAIAVWAPGSVSARSYGPMTGWAPTVDLDSGQRDVVVKAAMNEAGQGVAAWCTTTGVLSAANYDRSAGWGSVARSAPSCCVNTDVGLSPNVSAAISETGRVFAVGAKDTRLCSLARSTSGVWESNTEEFVAVPSGLSLPTVSSPQVAASKDGRGMMVWLHRTTASSYDLKAREYNSPAGWGPHVLGPSGLGRGNLGVAYATSSGSDAGAAILFRQGIQLAYVTYSTSTRALSSPVAITGSVSPAEAPFYLRVSGDPNAGLQGVTAWRRLDDSVWVTRVGL
jgi:hypothetical protein